MIDFSSLQNKFALLVEGFASVALASGTYSSNPPKLLAPAAVADVKETMAAASYRVGENYRVALLNEGIGVEQS